MALIKLEGNCGVPGFGGWLRVWVALIKLEGNCGVPVFSVQGSVGFGSFGVVCFGFKSRGRAFRAFGGGFYFREGSRVWG